MQTSIIPIIPIIQALAGLYVLYVGVIALNRMTKATRHMVRCGYIALVTSGAAAIASCFIARDILDCVMAVGIALYLAANRRAGRATS